MLFSEWKTNNFNNIMVNLQGRLIGLYGAIENFTSLRNDIDAWFNELKGLTLMYSEEYVNNFITNELYEFSQKNYLLYRKLASFNQDGGFSDQDKEDIKNSYSVGGFDTINQDLTSGALRNDHSTSTKNKLSNLDVLNKLKEIKLLEREKFLNKIKECLVIIW